MEQEKLSNYKAGWDSFLFGKYDNINDENNNQFRLLWGKVLFPQTEPAFIENYAVVQIDRGGTFQAVNIPAGQVDLSPIGLPSPVALGVHGLFTPLMPGQKVLLGFPDGEGQMPVIIQTYAQSGTTIPAFETAHFLPLTQKAHSGLDVVLGHYSGSFIALRSTLPLPAEIDLFSPSAITMTTAGFVAENIGGAKTSTVGGACSVSIGGAYSLNVGAAASVSVGGAYTLNASQVSITTSVVIVNAGARPVAAYGDLVPTSLGLQPIQATGSSVLVP